VFRRANDLMMSFKGELRIETNIDWLTGLGKVTAWIAAHAGMWPAFAFRILAVAVGSDVPPTLRTLAVHFQASPTPKATSSKTRLQARS